MSVGGAMWAAGGGQVTFEVGGIRWLSRISRSNKLDRWFSCAEARAGSGLQRAVTRSGLWPQRGRVRHSF